MSIQAIVHPHLIQAIIRCTLSHHSNCALVLWDSNRQLDLNIRTVYPLGNNPSTVILGKSISGGLGTCLFLTLSKQFSCIRTLFCCAIFCKLRSFLIFLTSCINASKKKMALLTIVGFNIFLVPTPILAGAPNCQGFVLG